MTVRASTPASADASTSLGREKFMGRVSRGNQALRAELSEAVSKAEPHPPRQVCLTWPAPLPAPKEGTAC